MNETRARVAIARGEEAQTMPDYEEIAPEEYKQMRQEAEEAQRILGARA